MTDVLAAAKSAKTAAPKTAAKAAPTAQDAVAAAPVGERKTVDLSAIQDQSRAPKTKPATITVTNSKI